MKSVFRKPKSRNPLVFIGRLIALLLLVSGCFSLNSGLFRSKAASESVSQRSVAPLAVESRGLAAAAQLASWRAAIIPAELFAPTLGNYLNLLPMKAASAATDANLMPMANTAPTINSVIVMRTAGAAGANSTIANVSDADQAANTLTVTVNGAASATLNGVTVSGLSISAGGVVTANVVAAAGAVSGDFTLRVTDSASATTTATPVVIVTSPACSVGSVPLWNQQAHNFASDGAATDFFGVSVSISGDTAIVGAYQDDTAAGSDAGSAYIFIRNGTVWTQQQKLTALDGAANDQFGISVAISGDTAIVGAYGDDTAGGTDAGSAYIFTRSGTVWTQQQKLTTSDGAVSDLFGVSVSISGDTAIVGAWGNDTAGGSNAGSAYVFTRSAGLWTEQQQLIASDGAVTDNFGVSVSISGDTAIVGAYQDDTAAGSDAGSAYIFIRNGTVWTQQQKLTASDGAGNDQFGRSVSISGDSAIVGAYQDDTAGGLNAGSVYVFTRSGTVWTEQQKLIASDGAAGEAFGISVAISGDTAIVGANLLNTPGRIDAGAAYVFTRSGTVWTQQQKLTASDGAANDQFSYAVALSGDSAIIGARFDDTAGGTDAGSSYIFTRVCNLTPTINAQAGISRQQGSPGSNSTIATVSDAETAPGSLLVTVTSANPANGVTLSNIVNSGGNITANLVASCVATNASFTLQVSDGTSSSTATLMVTVTSDLQAPSLTCPANVSVNVAAGVCTAVATYTTPTATDNCPGATVSCSPASGTAFPKGVTTVTCTATDSATIPNTTACTFTITVVDNQPPTFPSGCLANQTVNTTAGQCQATITYSNPAVADNCTGATASCTPASGGTFAKGVTTVTCTATDTATVPNTATCTFTVTVVDNQAPSLTCPANVSVNTAVGQCQATATYTTPTATDNCPGTTVSCTPASGGTFPKGVTTVTCTATDTATVPNTTTCSFTVTVVDNQPPTFLKGCPANQTLTTGGNCANVSYNNPAISDNCPGATVSCSPASGSCFPAGTTTVTCTATDTATVPNTATCMFTVTVTQCTITCPANINVANAPNQCGAVVTFAPTPVPVCGTVSCSPASGSFFPKGTTSVTCNTTVGPSCSFTVTVTDTQPPGLTCPVNQTALTPLPGGTSVVVNYPAPTVSDNCPGVITVCFPPSGSTFNVGVTTVSCTATDASSNTTKCSFTVTVYNACLQDDSNATTVLVFNTLTGDYRFCCNGTVFTGKGTVTKLGNTWTLTHNGADRKVLARLDGNANSATASLQSPAGTTRCTITDRNITNNSCQC